MVLENKYERELLILFGLLGLVLVASKSEEATHGHPPSFHWTHREKEIFFQKHWGNNTVIACAQYIFNCLHRGSFFS